MWSRILATLLALFCFVGLVDAPTVVLPSPPPPPPGLMEILAAAASAIFAATRAAAIDIHASKLIPLASRVVEIACDHATQIHPAAVAFCRAPPPVPISPPAAARWTAPAQSGLLACGILCLLAFTLCAYMAYRLAHVQAVLVKRDRVNCDLRVRLADYEERKAKPMTIQIGKPGVQAAANDDGTDGTDITDSTGEPAPVDAASKAKLMTIRIGKPGVQAAANDDSHNGNGNDSNDGNGDGPSSTSDNANGGGGGDDDDGRAGRAIDVNESDWAGPSVAAARNVARRDASAAIVVAGKRQRQRKRKVISFAILRVVDAGRQANVQAEN
ncbi:hypothetical protein H4R19_002866 [Coemansia spiralis]|nr:hypothetical protein H4R19_002866 [Coemansia spiralis]